MKNVLTAMLLIAFSSTQAQKISDYKYIHVPDNFTGFTDNKYELNSRLKYFLNEKKYIILKDNKNEWPVDITNNPCSIATADIVNLKGFTRNKLAIEFKDCNNKTLENFEGISSIKEFDKGYQEALKFALVKIQNSNPTLKVVKNPVITTNEKISIPEPKGIEVVSTNIILTDGKKSYQKIELKDGSFMLMNENGTEVVAKFEPALKKDIYRVIVTNENSKYLSVGYNNENSISYEVLENNNWKEIKLNSK